MSYGRMTERETALAAEVQAILDEAEAVDAAEDQLYGDARGDELPPELRTREGQLARTREAKAALEAKARERTGNQAAVPAPKAQRNFTDPQSRIMLSRPDGWVQGYNVGIAVTSPAAMPARPPTRSGAARPRPSRGPGSWRAEVLPLGVLRGPSPADAVRVPPEP